MKYEEYKKMVLKDSTVKKEYDALQREFDAKKQQKDKSEKKTSDR